MFASSLPNILNMRKTLLQLSLCIVVFSHVALGNRVNLERIYKQFDPAAAKIETHVQTTFNEHNYFSLTSNTYEQILDHFNPQLNTTWQQRYYIGNEEAWKKQNKTGPIFLYVGGESELHSSAVKSGAQFEQAKKYGALLVALEHRYYGESLPTEDLSTPNLQFLSSRQGLADLADFRKWISSTYSAHNNTWIVFGCSYPGCLSAWFHLKYPHLVTGSIAGSAPVEAEAAFYQYDEQIATSAGPKCANAIRNATLTVEKLLDSNTTNSRVKQDFGCEMIQDDVAFLYAIADMVAYAIQYGQKDKLCDDFMLKNKAFDGYVAYSKWLLQSLNKTCLEFDLLTSTYLKPDPKKNLRQWMYQSCTEFGYFQTAPKNNSLRSTRITLEWHYSVCDKLFGQPLRPEVNRTNAVYGGNQLRTTNTIFTNGSLDPWKHLSITSSSNSTRKVGVDSIIIDQKAHCSNFYLNDTKAVQEARKQVSSYIGCFLDPITVCKKCQDDGGICWGDCSCHFQGKGDGSNGHLTDTQVIAVSAVAVVVGCAVGAAVVGICQNFCFKRRSSFMELD